MMNEAPERIWAQDAQLDERDYIGGGWWDARIGSTEYPNMVEYTRADIHHAEIERLTTLLEESRTANRKNIATMAPIAKRLKERAEKAEAALEESKAVNRVQISVISEIAGQLKERAEKAEAALAKAKGEDA